MPHSDPTGSYCDYLDKEMTIMGLLSTFAVVVPAVVFDRVAGSKDAKDANPFAHLWADEKALLGTGSVVFFLAALAFYLQRSQLAFYLGQLRLSQTKARYIGLSERNLLREADSWQAWIPYQCGFTLLTLGFVLYGFLFFSPAAGSEPWRGIEIGCVAAAFIYMSINWRVKRVGAYADDPWRLYFSRLSAACRAIGSADTKKILRALRRL